MCVLQENSDIIMYVRLVRELNALVNVNPDTQDKDTQFWGFS